MQDDNTPPIDPNELTLDARITTSVYIKNNAALAFEQWFFNVFLGMHPDLALDFDFGFDMSPEQVEYLLITNHNPAFTTDALHMMFEAYRLKNPDIMIAKNSKLTVIKD